MSSSAHSTWVNIDLSIIENNVSLLARLSAVPVMAVVKAMAIMKRKMESHIGSEY